VPEELYQKFKKISSSQTDFYQVKRIKKNGQEIVLILPSQKEINIDLFSPWEIKLMEKLVEIYGEKWIRADIFSEASHQQIKAWQKAYQRKPNSIMKFEDELEDLDLPEEVKKVYLERLAVFEELTASQ